MDFITKWSMFTLRLLKYEEVIDLFDDNDYKKAEYILKKFGKRNVNFNKEKVKQTTEYGVLMFWGETIKYLIVLSIAFYLDIFTATFWVMNMFSILRRFAGGVHMSTFNKCFAVMIVVFLSLGYLINNVYSQINSINSLIFLTLGLMWSIIMAYKYSPQERQDKTDKDCDNGNKMKYRTIKFIIINYMFCNLFIHNQIISLSIFTGILLEMFTITPIGTKLFQWVDKGKVIE